MSSGPTLAVDLHVHSEDSYDGHEPVELLLEHAATIGLDGIVVTDHDVIGASLTAAELAPSYGLVGIPGVEVSTAHGHLLAVGVTERPPPGRPFAETVRAVRDAGGAAVVPHPFQRFRHGVRRSRLVDVATEVDAVEVYNSMAFTGYRNRRARAFATDHDRPAVGGSDAHYLPNLGRAYTEIEVATDGPVTGADVVDAVRRGATHIRGRRTPIPRSVRQYATGAVRKGLYEVTSRAPLVPAYPSAIAQWKAGE
ncbi:MAG: CehA/McbA family metallohydrolase [Halobacteriaceae archaeon]